MSNGGPVTLTDVAGAVVATSHGGSVTARLSRVSADKAMSFISFGGNVDVNYLMHCRRPETTDQ